MIEDSDVEVRSDVEKAEGVYSEIWEVERVWMEKEKREEEKMSVWVFAP